MLSLKYSNTMISLALVPTFINCTYDLYILKKNKFDKLLFLNIDNAKNIL
jgi:hypothetical protein